MIEFDVVINKWKVVSFYRRNSILFQNILQTIVQNARFFSPALISYVDSIWDYCLTGIEDDVDRKSFISYIAI